MRDDSTVDLPCSIAAVPAEMNSFLHLDTADDATLYLRQIPDIVEEPENTSMTILAYHIVTSGMGRGLKTPLP